MDRINQLLEFSSESPHDPFLLYCLALEYEKTGDDIKAEEYFMKLKLNHPDYLATYYHFGKFLEKSGLADKAQTIYEDGLALALQQKDMHSYSELLNAKNELTNNYDVEFD